MNAAKGRIARVAVIFANDISPCDHARFLVCLGKPRQLNNQIWRNKMLKKLITFAVLLGLLGFIGARQATAQDKAYVLVHIDVEDFDRYFAE